LVVLFPVGCRFVFAKSPLANQIVSFTNSDDDCGSTEQLDYDTRVYVIKIATWKSDEKLNFLLVSPVAQGADACRPNVLLK
jgi:hypothetical protein